MAINTTTQLTQPVNVIHRATFLRSAMPYCPYFTGSLPGEIARHNGTFTCQWRSMTALTPTVTALTPLTGTPTHPLRAGTALAVTDINATVSKYGDFVFVNEESDLINFNTQTDKIMETLGIQAGQSLNRLQRNELEDNSTLVYTDGGSADGDVVSAISVGVIRSVKNTLNRNSALLFTPEFSGSTNVGTTPLRPALWGICHSDVEEDIRLLGGFKAVETYSVGLSTMTGEFGSVDGVRFLSTPEASIDADSGGSPGASLRSTSAANADLYTTVIFGREAHGSVGLDQSFAADDYMAGDKIPGVEIVSHARGSSGTSDPLNELSSVGWKAWHAPKVLNGNWIRGIRTGASKLV